VIQNRISLALVARARRRRRFFGYASAVLHPSRRARSFTV
jgi:hypothetical protein